MEKLTMIERGGKNHRGISPKVGKDDSEARKLRELDDGIGLELVSLELRKNL
jgi:hypothetical protein